MPWEEKNLMLLKKEFIEFAKRPDANMTVLCQQYGISRKTGYQLLKRYHEQGEPGLSPRSKRPHTHPNSTPDGVVKKILAIRQQHPYWGARKIQALLQRAQEPVIPATSCIHKLLQQHQLIDHDNKPTTHYRRFEHAAPNDLWQMDFKGHFPYAQGRCHPLTILDDHSRFAIALQACQNEQADTVKQRLVRVFSQYGLPGRINVDNGPPWGACVAQAKYTALSIWLIKLGVRISYSRHHHPQTNGKDERFHRTLKEEVLKYHYFRSLKQIEQVFEQWRYQYNSERPHQALDMQVPAQRYAPSYRVLPQTLSAYEYAEDYVLRKVDQRGRLFIHNRAVFVGCAFTKEIIGLRHLPDQTTLAVYFRQQKLGEIQLNKIAKGTLVNLYTKRVLSN